MDKIKATVLSVENTWNVIQSYNAYVRYTTTNNDDIIEKFKGQIAEVERKINSAVDDMLTTSDKNIKERIHQRIKTFEDEKLVLLARLAEEQRQKAEIVISQSALQSALDKLRQLVNSGSDEHKRVLIDQFLNKVFVYHDRVEVILNILPKSLNGGREIPIDIETMQEWQKAIQNNEKEPKSGSFSMQTDLKSWPANNIVFMLP